MFQNIKPTMETYEFDLTEGANFAQQSAETMLAIAAGNLPPDVGKSLIDAIKATIDIEEATDIKERLEALEKQYANQSGDQ